MTTLTKPNWAVIPLWETKDGQCTCRAGTDCTSPGKHPRTPRGIHNATSDPDRLAAWHDRWPNANWGLACGPDNGILVVDVDNQHGGLTAWARLLDEHGPIVTPTCITGGGGLHLYFHHPEVAVKNSVGRIAPGIDVKARGGHVVMAGGSHVNGRYEWQDGQSSADLDFAEVPEWLLNLIV